MESDSYAEGLFAGARAPFLFSALARALLRDPAPAAALDAAHLLGLQPDGLHRDRACFQVASGSGPIPLAEWIARERGALAGCARLSPRILRLRRDASSPFDFSMEEFGRRALPIYDGSLHSWPQHDVVTEAFPTWPEERQLDFVHAYLEYFSANGSDADAPIVEWVRSRRRFRLLFVAEAAAAPPPAEAENTAGAADRLAEELRLAALRLFDLCLDRVAERLKEPPGFAAQYPDKRERLIRTIRVDEARAERFMPVGAAAELVWMYQEDECFPPARARRPLERLTDARSSFNIGLPEALSRLGEPDTRAAEIQLAERVLELHTQWDNYGRGRAEYEANRLPEFETAVRALRGAADDYLARAW